MFVSDCYLEYLKSQKKINSCDISSRLRVNGVSLTLHHYFKANIHSRQGKINRAEFISCRTLGIFIYSPNEQMAESFPMIMNHTPTFKFFSFGRSEHVPDISKTSFNKKFTWIFFLYEFTCLCVSSILIIPFRLHSWNTNLTLQ